MFHTRLEELHDINKYGILIVNLLQDRSNVELLEGKVTALR